MKPSKHAQQNERGFWFDPEVGFCGMFNRDKTYTVHGLRLCLVFDQEMMPIEYLLFKDDAVVAASQSFEQVVTKADLIRLTIEKGW